MIVRRLKNVEEKTRGGLVLPRKGNSLYEDALVVAVSKGLETPDGYAIKPGMVVVCPNGQFRDENVVFYEGVPYSRISVTSLHGIRTKDRPIVFREDG